MIQEEKGFNLRFSLEAMFPDDYVKPELLKVIFDALRRHPSWAVHVRNRGVSPEDEIEIAMMKDFTKDLSTLN